MQTSRPFDQAVDAREADPRLKRAKPRPERLRSLATLAVMRLPDRRRSPHPASAGAGAGADPGEQRGEDHRLKRFSLADFDQAQAFTTGVNSAGYTLTSVEIDMEAHAEDATAFTVKIHSINSTFEPGRRLGTLSKPRLTVGRTYLRVHHPRYPARGRHDVFRGDRQDGFIDVTNNLYINNTNSTGEDFRKGIWLEHRHYGSQYRDLGIRAAPGRPYPENSRRFVSTAPPSPPTATLGSIWRSRTQDAAENAGYLLFDVRLSRSLRNTVKVNFETISGGTATEGVDYHARRTYTHVILAGDRTAQMGFVLIEDTSQRGRRDGEGKAQQRARWSMRTATHLISVLNITTRRGNGNDHRAGDHHDQRVESDHWDPGRDRGRGRRVPRFQSQALAEVHRLRVLRLREHLGRHRHGRNRLPQVPESHVLDADRKTGGQALRAESSTTRMNDDRETVKVKISNARLCEDASQTLSITRAEATGTIRNTEPASGDSDRSEESVGAAVTPVPALPVAGVGILGLLLALLGSRRRLNNRRQLDSSRGR